MPWSRGRRINRDARRRQNVVELGEQFLCLVLLLGFFSFGDELANRAGMLAVESFDQRILERVGL